MGEPGVHEAAHVARRMVPYLAASQPTVLEDSDEYNCPGLRPSCLNNGRFKVRALYGHPVGGLTYAPPGDNLLSDTGVVFWFFDRDNPELLLKVVNGCWLNDHWWVFGSAATDLGYEVAIDDLAEGGGTVKYQHNGGGVIVGDNGYSTAAGVINDTSAFPCGNGTTAMHQDGESHYGAWREAIASLEYGQAAAATVAVEQETRAAELSTTTGEGLCPSNCVANGRFSLGVSYRRRAQYVGAARSSAFVSDSGAVFSFFDQDNPELLLKVVDGCWLNGHYWVFGSAATDLRYSVSVTDHAAVSRRSYASNGNGRITSNHGDETRAGVINDTSAFPCNP